MPELRRGPTREGWVIIAPERAKRPSDFERAGAPSVSQSPEDCPFCAGNEEMTPAELYRDVAPDGWFVRVVPNKFPTLQAYDDLGRMQSEGLFDRMNGLGTHEVVIESPDHETEIQDLPEMQVKRVIDAYVARLAALQGNEAFRYVLLFRNHGIEAGASLAHPHSQIVAMPIVPQEVRTALSIARRYYAEKERCLFCDVMLAELRVGDRIIEEDNGFVVWAPYDSRVPFELVIYPKRHAHDFTSMDDGQRHGLARILRRTLKRLTLLLGDVPYNLVLKTTPNPVPRQERPEYWETLPHDYHWRIAVTPRLTREAGFEWGTGFHINPTPPEAAAEALRGVAPPEGFARA